MTIYEELKKVMQPEHIDHHKSDLYVKKTKKSEQILNKHGLNLKKFLFIDLIDHTEWYDIPFMYDPYWLEKGV